MSLGNKLRNEASVDSRRVAGGIYCKMISDPVVLKLLKQYNYIPGYANISPVTGYDVVSGLAFVIPNHSADKILQVKNYLSTLATEQSQLIAATKEKNKEDELNTSDLLKIKAHIEEKEHRAIDYLGNLLILVTLSPDAQLGIPNAKQHDVFIETQEVLPPEAYIVTKPDIKINKNATKKLSESPR